MPLPDSLGRRQYWLESYTAGLVVDNNVNWQQNHQPRQSVRRRALRWLRLYQGWANFSSIQSDIPG